MGRNLVLAGLSWLLLGPPAVASAPPWTGKRVVVYDYTSLEWDGVVAQTVRDFNAMLPPRAPRLIYRRLAEMPCDDAPLRRGVVVCLGGDVVGGEARRIRPERTQLALKPSLLPEDRAWVTCHEMMHLITGIPDRYESGLGQSCVWGYLAHPGPVDADYARKVYRQRHHR